MIGTCYICQEEQPIDNHHIDCAHGEISDETEPLCRRCHRTYHDLGVEWFDDEYLDKAIEIENRRREITYANLKDPVIPLHLLERKDIKRSDYWNKTHHIEEQPKQRKAIEQPEDIVQRFIRLCMAPLCGWDWLQRYAFKTYPEQWIELIVDNKLVGRVSASAKLGTLRKVMKQIEICPPRVKLGIDLEHFRKVMPPELFEAYVHTMGSVEGYGIKPEQRYKGKD